MKTTLSIAAVVIAALVASCGGEAPSIQAPASPVGTYRLDVARTLSDGGAAKAGGAARALLEERLGPDSYRLEIREGGTFEMTVHLGGDPTVVAGDWQVTEEGVLVTTLEMDGQPAAAASSVLTQEPGYLVISEDGRQIYLRKV